ncbi:hypothetical protein [Notoacmeibacter ruber]|uniref:Fibronectin attachment protein n=1 Tax=Notoacmeibacter ruber TaxID=2670375 RepID=A0A3L7JA16_9HYPH|nr:hypothetical protein [Notoacmeibacter ruber]RLQ87598.1 hypothetical protein D8780_04645 [Notoacmeibacter ruber]
MMPNSLLRFFFISLFAGSCLIATSSAFALSEVKSEDGEVLAAPAEPLAEDGLPADESVASEKVETPVKALPPLEDDPQLAPEGEPGPVETAPLPPPSPPGAADPVLEDTSGTDAEEDVPSPSDNAGDGEEEAVDKAEPAPATANGDEHAPAPENKPLPPVSYDMTALPEPVARMRGLILEAAKTGDIERLRPYLGIGEKQTALSIGRIEDDPIAFLKDVSGDEDGQEILAILSEVLEAGYVHFDEGQETELYVWPYFFGRSLESLTPEQKVELFRIVTAGDYADMLEIGAYVFYRVGITPDGEWAFFVSGD